MCLSPGTPSAPRCVCRKIADGQPSAEGGLRGLEQRHCHLLRELGAFPERLVLMLGLDGLLGVCRQREHPGGGGVGQLFITETKTPSKSSLEEKFIRAHSLRGSVLG